MRRLANSIGAASVGVLVLLGAAGAAAAPQDPRSAGRASQAASAQQGPLVLQPVDSGLVVTPEVKFTPVNGSTGTMVGGYAGWLLEDTFLLAGAAYWLTDGADGASMSYGGLLVGWTVPVTPMLRLGGRGLFGWGYSELPVLYPYQGYAYKHGPPHGPSSQWVWVGDSFFVFEPQATAAIRLTKTVSFDIAGGYRLVADAGGLDRELRGGFGSIGIRFGPF
jgi:hypothetical protein